MNSLCYRAPDIFVIRKDVCQSDRYHGDANRITRIISIQDFQHRFVLQNHFVSLFKQTRFRPLRKKFFYLHIIIIEYILLMRFHSADLVSSIGTMFIFSHTFGIMLTETICFGRFACKHIFICHRKANEIVSLSHRHTIQMCCATMAIPKTGADIPMKSIHNLVFTPKPNETIPLDGWRVKLAK